MYNDVIGLVIENVHMQLCLRKTVSQQLIVPKGESSIHDPARLMSKRQRGVARTAE
jgi:hypothetical protein